eukprot:15333479-Ditylum_brightwellii.AAC.1
MPWTASQEGSSLPDAMKSGTKLALLVPKPIHRQQFVTKPMSHQVGIAARLRVQKTTHLCTSSREVRRKRRAN